MLPGESLKDAKWEPIYTYLEKEDRVEAAKPIRDFLADAVFDQGHVWQLGRYLTPNAATPLPELATGNYPPLKLPGINPLPVAKPGPLGKKPVKGDEIAGKFGKKAEGIPEIEKVPFKDLPEAVLNKLMGRFNVVSQTGSFTEPPFPTKDLANKEKLGTKQQAENNTLPNGFAFSKIPDKGKVLIRFLDVDVQPGMTYQYKIQLVFANPNYKLEKAVVHPDLAVRKVLLDKDRFVWTKAITIPNEYRFYIFDQMSPNQSSKSDQKLLTTRLRRMESIDYKPLPKDRVAIQIHQWVGKTTDVTNLEYFIADWVVAERLFVGRGAKIGHREVEVEIPVWNDKKNDFEIGEGYVNPKTAPKITPFGVVKAGVPVNFLRRRSPEDIKDLAPVVVDFEGGHGGARQYRGDVYDTKTNSTLEVLLLGPDGKLTVLNSRDDADSTKDTAAGRRAAEAQRAMRNGGRADRDSSSSVPAEGEKGSGGQGLTYN